MGDQTHHLEVLNQVYNQLKVIFEKSEQSMYLYLDDVHKVCNQIFSDLLGYGSPDDWAKTADFMELVDEQSQGTLVTAYQNAMQRLIGSTIEVTWKKKGGGTVDSSCILVPISYNGHLMALHFISNTS